MKEVREYVERAQELLVHRMQAGNVSHMARNVAQVLECVKMADKKQQDLLVVYFKQIGLLSTCAAKLAKDAQDHIIDPSEAVDGLRTVDKTLRELTKFKTMLEGVVANEENLRTDKVNVIG